MPFVMPFVMPGVQVDIDTSIVTLFMPDRAPCNPLADSIRPDSENLCRLWYRVPLRRRRVLLRHALHHALIMPAVLGILPCPRPSRSLEAILAALTSYSDTLLFPSSL